MNETQAVLAQPDYVLMGKTNERNGLAIDPGTIPAAEIFDVKEIMDNNDAGMFSGEVIVVYAEIDFPVRPMTIWGTSRLKEAVLPLSLNSRMA